MELHQLIEEFNKSGSTKTAEAVPTGGAEADELKAALDDVLESGQQKSAAADEGDPVQGLMKMAEELSSMDKEAEESHVRNLAIAFADTAHRRWNELNEKVGSLLETSPLADAIKIAASQGYADASAVLGYTPKTAATDAPTLDALVKQAEAGDPRARAQLEKFAAEYAEGQEAALQEVHKTAANEFLKGAAEVKELVRLTQAQRASK